MHTTCFIVVCIALKEGADPREKGFRVKLPLKPERVSRFIDQTMRSWLATHAVRQIQRSRRLPKSGDHEGLTRFRSDSSLQCSV